MNTATMSPLAGTIPDADRELREHIRDFALKDAEPWHREHLTRLYGIWDDMNREQYGCAMVPPIIQLLEPSAPMVYGSCAVVSGTGARSQIRLRPSLLRGTHPHMKRGTQDPEGLFRFVADVLMHEQIHQYQQEVTGVSEPNYHGHGPRFCTLCNEIGADMGLGPVIVKKRTGQPDGPRCAQWPHSVRPLSYYLGAYVPPNGDRQAKEAQEIARCRAYLEQRGYVVTAG